MEVSVISAIAGGMATIITGIIGYLVAKQNNKKDLTLNDRIQLSKDEVEFRNTLIEEIKALKAEILTLKERNAHLENELLDWKKKYSDLEIDHKRLKLKISLMEEEMKGKLSHGEIDKLSD